MSNIGGANVEIRTKADTSELRQAIKDYKDGKISVDDLRKATDDLKASVKDQALAIKAITQANRVNFYELNEGIRVLRGATSMFRDLNSVYQTLILKTIDGTQVTVQQQQAYDDLKTSTDDIVSALSVLGDTNVDVKKGFTDIIDQAGRMNSTQLTDLINNLDDVKKSVTFTPEELTALDDFENKLKKIKQDTISKEDAKNMQDYVGSIITLATTVSTIGTFAANLAKLHIPNSGGSTPGVGGSGTAPGGGSGAGGLGQGAGLAGLFLSIFGPSIADTIMGALGDKSAQAREQQRQLQGQAFSGSISGNNGGVALNENNQLVPINGTVGNTTLHMNISNLTLGNGIDIENFAKMVSDYIQSQLGLKGK